MRSSTKVVNGVSLAVVTLLTCHGAASGGPAILEPPAYEPGQMPYLFAAFMVTWVALVAMLTYSEYQNTCRHEAR